MEPIINPLYSKNVHHMGIFTCDKVHDQVRPAWSFTFNLCVSLMFYFTFCFYKYGILFLLVDEWPEHWKVTRFFSVNVSANLQLQLIKLVKLEKSILEPCKNRKQNGF